MFGDVIYFGLAKLRQGNAILQGQHGRFSLLSAFDHLRARAGRRIALGQPLTAGL